MLKEVLGQYRYYLGQKRAFWGQKRKKRRKRNNIVIRKRCYLESSVHSLQGVVRCRPEGVCGMKPCFLPSTYDTLVAEIPEEQAQDCHQLLVNLDLNVLPFQELVRDVEALFIDGEQLEGCDVEAKLIPNLHVSLLDILHMFLTGFLLVP